MATIIINAIDTGYSIHRSLPTSSKELRAKHGFSDTNTAFIEWGNFTIPTNSYIEEATLRLEHKSGSTADTRLFCFDKVKNRSNFYGVDDVNFNSNAFILTQIPLSASSTYQLHANFLNNLVNGSCISKVSGNTSLVEYHGVNTTSVPYIDVTHRPITISDKPKSEALRLQNGVLYYNPYVNFYGSNSISEVEIRIVSEVGTVTTLRQTSNFGTLNIANSLPKSSVKISVRAKSLFGTWGDYSNELELFKSTYYNITITRPSNYDEFVIGNNISLGFTRNATQINNILIYYSFDNVNYSLLAETGSFVENYNVSTQGFKQGFVYFKVIGTDGKVYSSATNLTTFVYGTPVVDTLNRIGDFWEENISFSWRGTYATSYEYECYYNNNIVKSGTLGNVNELVVAGETYKGTLNSSFRIRPKNEFNSRVVFGNWREISFTLKDIEATISNLIVSGDKWEKPISLSWLSASQQQFKVEVLKDNLVVKTYTGTTEKRFTIPAEALTSGLHTFKVWVGYKNRFVNYDTQNVTLKDIIPTVNNVSVSGANVDLPISVSWESTDQQQYILEVWQGEEKKHTFNGTTSTTHEIQAGTLSVGLTEFRVKVAYKDRWTDYKTFSTSLVETLPSIAILEPDGRIVERDLPLRVWWTSQNQTTWKLTVDNGQSYTGTSEKEYIIQAGTLATGRHEITLEVTLSIAGKQKKAYKTVEFIVQGKPPLPTITSGNSFTNNRPTITWDSQDATAFRVEVIGYYDSGWQNGALTEYKIKDYLPNGNYRIALTVKNQFNITSDVSTQQITINAVIPKSTTLKVYDNYNYNVLRFDMLDYAVAYIMRNNEVIGKSYDGTYTDYTPNGKNVYKVQMVTYDDRYSYSNEVVSYTMLDYPILSIGDMMLEMKYTQDKSIIQGGYNSMATKEYYAGRKLPITRHGEFEDATYSFNYSEFNGCDFTKLLDMVRMKKPILYRSNKRKLWLSFDSIGFIEGGMVIDYTINAYEIDANEVIAYD